MGKGYDHQLYELRRIGDKLTLALEKAERCNSPGTWDHKTAWLLAEEGTKALGEVVDVYWAGQGADHASGDRLLKRR